MKTVLSLFKRGKLTEEELVFVTEKLVNEPDILVVVDALTSILYLPSSEERLVLDTFLNNNDKLLEKIKTGVAPLKEADQKAKQEEMKKHYKKEIAWMQKYINENS